MLAQEVVGLGVWFDGCRLGGELWILSIKWAVTLPLESRHLLPAVSVGGGPGKGSRWVCETAPPPARLCGTWIGFWEVKFSTDGGFVVQKVVI